MQNNQSNQNRTSITLDAKQSQFLIDFYQTADASGYAESLLEIFETYLTSSNDYLGEIPQETIKNHFYMMHQVIKLVLIIEQKDVFKLQKVV